MDKKVVIPGEKIADGKLRIPNTFVEGDATYALVVGMLDENGRYIPLESRYIPKHGDTVVGVVTDVRHAGYEVDLNLPLSGFIPSKNTRIRLEFGDFVICRIKSISESGSADLADVRRLPRGKVVDFPTAKIPRLIGRQSSMVNLLKEHSGGDVVVGINGYVWMSERCNLPMLMAAIDYIRKHAHRSGLTDAVAALLKKTG